MLEAVVAHGLDGYPSLRQSQLSFARLKMGQPHEALAAAEQAIGLCGATVNDCVGGLRERARARAALGDEPAALADINDALDRVEKMRTQLVPSDFFKQDFPRTQDSLYSEAIALNLKAHQDAHALETAELARSRAFVDLLAARAIDPTGPSIVFRGSADSPGGTNGLRSAVAARSASVIDIARNATRLGSTFVLYWVADDRLTIWTVTPDGAVNSRQVNVLRSKLEALVTATGTLADSTATGTRSASAWRELYDLLIQPVRSALPRPNGSLLTIVPHGPLVSLSFAGLQDSRGRYLLEDYTLHYAPAASMFQFTAAAKRPAGRSGDMLLIADPALPVRSRLDEPLPRLAGARAETESIAKLVPAGRATMLRDTSATESAVKAAAVDKSVLHFATHAIVRDDDPFGSFLALGATSGGPDSDGLLTAQEIYGWNLHADLVVLSACRSGAGHITGDGVATFARAFMYAGTPSLIVSLWDVADEASNRLLPGFYRAWFSGQSKARALRAAQLQLLRDLRAGKVQVKTAAGLVALPEHPVFWAGFALIGEPE
jgi:CHAT domain-containing protein